jgi:hypothetical protein
MLTWDIENEKFLQREDWRVYSIAVSTGDKNSKKES